MNEYIVKNCPANEKIYEMTGDFDANDLPIMRLDTANYCAKHKRTCDEVDNCLMKDIIETCKCYDNPDFNNKFAPFARGLLGNFEIEERLNNER